MGIFRGVAAVLAGLALVAPCASDAFAASHLVLSENGARVSPGAYALDYHLVFDGGCLQASKGEVVSNDRAKDVLVFGVPEESECLEEGFGVAGALRQVNLMSSGAATLLFKPKLAITEPGPCVYEFAHLKGEFPASIEVAIEGTGTANLRASLSSHGCEKSRTLEFVAVESGIDNEIFATEVIP